MPGCHCSGHLIPERDRQPGPLATSGRQNIGRPRGSSRQEKKLNGIHIETEGRNLSLFGDDMILFTENSKDSTKHLFEVINECSKLT